MSTVLKLTERGLVKPPKFLPNNIQYETIMGSVAYGVSNDLSDTDLYGFCIPEKETVFPHLRGEIPGFGQPIPKFEQWQEHHVLDQSAGGGKGRTYDLAIYNIVKYFQLCMENNPNMIDSLFTPRTCVLHSTQVGNMVRENRRLFLHKGAWHKFKGYAYSQIHKMNSKDAPVGKRQELVAQFGYDVKYAYHVVRLLDEVEQILTEGDIDLQRNREQLKSIRRGEWTQADILSHFERKERDLETLYTNSKLAHAPDEVKIKQLLLDCLEHHYGSLSECVVNVDAAADTLRRIRGILEQAGY
ncbi:MAG: nucleotidyltransferase domain-containing protein [Capsulimonas sp.]|uniref:nucleotidyltransferase domain-containing protein n=1 Tax=Capsulimonas sp. TaxID=2494211 RepID=UPI0032644BD7